MSNNKITIKEQVNNKFRNYALYVICSRGIPNFYDSLTPVQRLILEFAPTKSEKTLGLVGSVIQTGRYHHGDCLEYDTIINLADGTHIKLGEWFEKNQDAELLLECIDELTGEKTVG